MLTVQKIDEKIDSLKAMREELVKAERVGVINRIKEAIKVYAITMQELEGPAVKSRAEIKSANKRRKPVPYTRPEGCKHGAHYGYDGKVWTGHGRAPKWLLDHLADTGCSITELELK